MLRRSAFVLAAMFTIASLFSCSNDKTAKENKADQNSPQAATQQPAAQQAVGSGLQFTAPDVKGVSQSSTQWIGRQPVVLNFWGTWCPPCRREIPDLVKLYTEYHSRGIEMIGLAVKDEPQDVSAFSSEKGMQWVMLMASDESIRKYDVVNGVPTTIFLDRNGKEVGRFIGSRSYEDFRPYFEEILRGYSPDGAQ